ncbi:restriction endonuclease subunit S [Helicobacter pylori]|uniref:restriction endonuclease subunit S n=1 Tax=Helicobacter pylori TaxID=210 RepID=UPI00111948D6|nr:restriction endonuclease subunit S [Helicobacter pylori]
MNHIEKLLQTLAPKGVEFRKLGEVCDFQKGKSITKKAVTFGKVPVISGGRQPAYYHNEANRSGETIAISSSGVYAGYVSYWDIPVFLADSFSVSPKQKTLMPKYLFHYLTTQQDAIHATKSAGGIPHVYSKDLQNFLIPIPPLEVQQEIVKILDAFTELNTELKARKKQYEYYQNMLLDFNDINQNHKDAKMSAKPYPKRLKTLLQTLAPKGVEFRKLGEVCEILDNRRIPIAKNKRNPGIYPYYGANGIQDYIDSYIFDGDFVLVGEDGSVINKDNTPVVNWASGKIWVNNHAHVLQTKNELKLKFLYFYLQTIDVSYCVAGTPPKINQENLKKITIPIPPLEIQQEIVKILDAFTELNTELNTELKARKKQYEYYREKLLTFKPLNPLNNKELA